MCTREGRVGDGGRFAIRKSSEHNGAQFGAKRTHTRRVLLIAIGGATFIPRMLLAQSKQALVLIGWLEVGSRKSTGHRLSEVKQGLAAMVQATRMIE